MQEAGKPLRAVMRALLFRRDCLVDRRSPSTNGAENLEQLEGAIKFTVKGCRFNVLGGAFEAIAIPVGGFC